MSGQWRIENNVEGKYIVIQIGLIASDQKTCPSDVQPELTRVCNYVGHDKKVMVIMRTSEALD
jgi:hypothetical protein